MKNIFIEGIQGSGKSTLHRQIAAHNPNLKSFLEGDYSPIELAWCTWMTKVEYIAILDRYAPIADEIRGNTHIEGNHYIITYTRIITDIPGFHKDLEQFEIYNGRKSLQELKNIVLSRYKHFDGTDCLFECAFFQNIIEDMILFHQLSDNEIIDFYHKLFATINTDNFLLLYLKNDNLAENIRIIREERSDNQGNQLWYQLMLKFLITSPYGKAHGYQNFNDMIAHFEHRQRLELRIIDEVLKEHAVIFPAKQFNTKDVNTLIRQ